MRTWQILFWLLVAVACGVARAEPSRSAGVPPLPPTALGSEPLSQPGSVMVPSASGAVSAQPQGLDYPRVLAALGVVVGLILFLRWFGRFFFPAAAGSARNRAVEVLSRTPLSPKQQVMLLRVGKRLIVVGDTGSQMSPLCEIDDADEVALLVGQLRDEKLAVPKRAFRNLFSRTQETFEPQPHSTALTELREQEDDMPTVMTARQELSGLRERVRFLAEQFKGA